ncbi:MAG: mechanosensitive ion channel family protein [Saprospiraceae bacterium]|nr:mechanosensitive ion channel family protein [Saprospiraceae bacterium]
MDFSNAFMFDFLLSVGGIALGLLLGWMLDRYVVRKWFSDHYVFGALKGAGVFVGLWVGVRLVLRYHQLPESWQQTIAVTWQSVLILAVTIYLARLIGRFIGQKMSDMNGLLPTASLLQNVARVVVFVIGILVLLQTFGISITPVLTALGVGGLAVALALQPTLSNLFSGIQIIASRKIRIGDFIRLENGMEGYVDDINWRSTTIKSLVNQTVIMPNSKLADSIVTNTWLPEPEVSIPIQVGISYDSDLEHVERVTLEVAQSIQTTHPNAVEGFEPPFRFVEFGDSSINFRVSLRAKDYGQQFLLRHDFIKALHARYKQEGINIPFPIRTLQLDDATQALLRKRD